MSSEEDSSGDEWHDTLGCDEDDDEEEEEEEEDDDDDDDEQEEEEGQNRRHRGLMQWRIHAQFLKSGNRSIEDITKWKNDMFEELGDDGSGLTKAQSYQRRSDACSIEEWKCSFGYRLKCPFKVRFTESATGILLEVCAFPCAFHSAPLITYCTHMPLTIYCTHACCAQVAGEHEHDHDKDRSKGVPIKYQELLEVRVVFLHPPRPPRANRIESNRIESNRRRRRRRRWSVGRVASRHDAA